MEKIYGEKQDEYEMIVRVKKLKLYERIGLGDWFAVTRVFWGMLYESRVYNENNNVIGVSTTFVKFDEFYESDDYKVRDEAYLRNESYKNNN